MRDLHMHTTFSDGKDTPEEMVVEGIRRGLTEIGISDHSWAEMDEASMKPENTEAYIREMSRLKEKYADAIRVRCGLELDYYSENTQRYDYLIGSVHWIRTEDGHYLPVDWTEDKLAAGCDQYFGGDWYALAEAYYRLEADVVRRTRCDIIGHFDLLTKFNEKAGWFDPTHPRYRSAWQRAADALLLTGKPFEVNTGAISRGYRTDAYPAAEIRAYLRSRGGRLILSSDAHRKENIGYAFDRFAGEC